MLAIFVLALALSTSVYGLEVKQVVHTGRACLGHFGVLPPKDEPGDDHDEASSTRIDFKFT